MPCADLRGVLNPNASGRDECPRTTGGTSTSPRERVPKACDASYIDWSRSTHPYSVYVRRCQPAMGGTVLRLSVGVMSRWFRSSAIRPPICQALPVDAGNSPRKLSVTRGSVDVETRGDYCEMDTTEQSGFCGVYILACISRHFRPPSPSPASSGCHPDVDRQRACSMNTVLPQPPLLPRP